MTQYETTKYAHLCALYSGVYFLFTSPCLSKSYAIITAWNPYSQRQARQENDFNNHRLRRQLGMTPYGEVWVGDREFAWVEASFCVSIELEMALNLARQFEQNAIYWVQDDQLFLVPCLADAHTVYLGRLSSRCVAYTQVTSRCFGSRVLSANGFCERF